MFRAATSLFQASRRRINPFAPISRRYRPFQTCQTPTLALRSFSSVARRRRWLFDDFAALFSWIFVGNTLFIFVGTTSFTSIALLLANSLDFQGNLVLIPSEYIAQKISDSLTRDSGMQVSFDSAIIPIWTQGRIRLKNVSVLLNADTWDTWCKTSGGTTDSSPIDGNFTFYDLKVESMDVSLSLSRWLEGRGLVHRCDVKGVRGVVDRRHVTFDKSWVPRRRLPCDGDFELQGFSVEDLLVSVLQPGGFRPYSVSVFAAQIPLLRRQWLMYDILSAESMVGMFENCIFSCHKPQLPSNEFPHWNDDDWAKMINSVPVDHANHMAQGPLGWITSGKLDIDLHILFPHTRETMSQKVNRVKEDLEDIKDRAIGKLHEISEKMPDRTRRQIQEFAEARTATRSAINKKDIVDTGVNTRPTSYYNVIYPAIVPDKDTLATTHTPADPKSVIMYWNVRMNDLRASVPLTSPDLSYLSNAMIQPIVAYLNSQRTAVDVPFSTRMDLDNFDGASTWYDAGLNDVLGREIGVGVSRIVYEALSGLPMRIGAWSVRGVVRGVVGLFGSVYGWSGDENN